MVRNATPPASTAALEWARLLSRPIDRPTANAFQAWVLKASQNWKLYLLAVVKHRLHAAPAAATKAAVVSLPVRTNAPPFPPTYRQGRTGKPHGLVPTTRTAFGLVGAGVPALGIATLIGVLPWRAGGQLVETDGAPKARALDDGSYVTLDPGTRLRVHFSKNRRDVSLERGAAVFEVTYDARRVFMVAIRGGSVESAGTTFRVADNDSRTEVMVYKGAVRIHGTQPGLVFALPVGGTAEVSPDGAVTIVPQNQRGSHAIATKEP
jgi:ferric-dicitrate binding protein FerR (iron transport regulator)